MNSWFAIGEQVLRQGQYYSEANGEYVIEEIISAEEMKHLHPTMLVPEGLYYGLKGFSVEKTNAFGHKTGGFSHHTHESNLRKKHKPSDESFKDMMQNIKSDVRVEEGVV